MLSFPTPLSPFPASVLHQLCVSVVTHTGALSRPSSLDILSQSLISDLTLDSVLLITVELV